MTRRVFLDASVVFSASYSSSGFARDLLIAGLRKDVEHFVGTDVLSEVVRNLSNKAPDRLTRLRGFEASRSFVVVQPDSASVRRCAALVEEKDAHVVAGALAAGATVIATYDRKHLLSQADVIREAFGVEVLTPDKVLRRLAVDDEGATL